jgi:hypothetical protein
VVRTERLSEELDLSHEDHALFAKLSGRDYNTDGLKKCGPTKAYKLAQSGITQSLYHPPVHIGGPGIL